MNAQYTLRCILWLQERCKGIYYDLTNMLWASLAGQQSIFSGVLASSGFLHISQETHDDEVSHNRMCREQTERNPGSYPRANPIGGELS
jgi:hypothetical protein